MPDLYGALGVDRSASAGDIRAAYRRQAKKAHPDAPGGSAEAFGKLGRAVAILSDPRRRAKYDTTGTVDEGVDNSVGLALELAFTTVCTAMAHVEQSGRRIEQTDIVGLAVGTLKQSLAELNGKIADYKRESAKALALGKRFKAKRGKPNHLAMMCEARARDIDRAADMLRKDVELRTAAIAILNDHTFAVDAPPPTQGFAQAPFWTFQA